MSKLIVAAMMTFGTLSARAQDGEAYPSKPVRVISPLGSGGAVEIIGRMVTQRMSESMGRQFVIDPRVGAGGSLGHNVAAKSPADGYTLLLSGSGYTILPLLWPITYDPFKDLTPISQMTLGCYMLIVPNSFQAATVKDFVARAKSNPGAINFGSSGVGSSVHFATEMFATAAGIKLTHVAYKEVTQSYVDLMNDRIQLVMSNTVSALPHVKAGRAKALAVTSAKRVAALPDIPTVSESGVPGFIAPVWTAIFAPSNVPPRILGRLNAEVIKAVNDPEFLKRQQSDGGQPIESLDQFKQTIRRELALNKKIAAEANIKPEQPR